MTRQAVVPAFAVSLGLLFAGLASILQGCDLELPTTTQGPTTAGTYSMGAPQSPTIYGASADDGGGWQVAGPRRRRTRTPPPTPLRHGGMSHGGFMNCGDGVELCGVMTLQTGLSTGVYKHDEPTPHGLWPQEGQFGNSKCLKPTESTSPPKMLYPCYENDEESRGSLIGFERHEWGKHGICAGTDDAKDFFTQVCAMTKEPLQIMERQIKGGEKDLHKISLELQRRGYWVYKESRGHNELQMAACATKDGTWMLSAPKDFVKNCGPNAGKPQHSSPSPVPHSPSPHPSGSAWGPTPSWNPSPTPSGGIPGLGGGGEPVCVMGKRGPACHSDADCLGQEGCVRCAKSHHCTAQTSREFSLGGGPVFGASPEAEEEHLLEENKEETTEAQDRVKWLFGAAAAAGAVLFGGGYAFWSLGSGGAAPMSSKRRSARTRGIDLQAAPAPPAAPAPTAVQPMLQYAAATPVVMQAAPATAVPVYTTHHQATPAVATAVPMVTYHVPQHSSFVARPV